MKTLPSYETMAGISVSMVEAARANDWDRLVVLGAELSRLRDELSRTPESPAGTANEAVRARKAELIRSILENDLEIRVHVEPWLESTRKLLSGAVRDRNVRAAYGAG